MFPLSNHSNCQPTAHNCEVSIYNKQKLIPYALVFCFLSIPAIKMQTVCLLGTTTLVLDEEEAMRHTLERMRGRGLALAMRKTLTPSDVNRHQSRLLITNGVVLWGQLSEEEQRDLVRPEGYVEIEVVDPRGYRKEMKLRMWRSLGTLVLNCGWMSVVMDNNLEAGINCILWSFRAGSKLCFALGIERHHA